MITLAISHNIFLTKEQRYALHDRQDIEIIGASVPVWFIKGNTSEPAEEVFVKYLIKNYQDDQASIKNIKSGYVINLPQLPPDYKPPARISDDEWRQMGVIRQEMWYADNKPPASSSGLLDIKDGGGGYLSFRATSKTTKNNTAISVVHFIEINSYEDLTETLDG